MKSTDLPALPAELRNEIRKYVVDRPDGVDILLSNCNRVLFDPWITVPAMPPITKVSRQIRDESLPLYFSENTFQFAPIYSWHLTKDFALFYNHVGPERTRMVRNVHMDVQCYYLIPDHVPFDFGIPSRYPNASVKMRFTVPVAYSNYGSDPGQELRNKLLQSGHFKEDNITDKDEDEGSEFDPRRTGRILEMPSSDADTHVVLSTVHEVYFTVRIERTCCWVCV